MKEKVITVLQWIFAVIGVMIAISCFTSGGAGVIGGIIVLLSAALVSPLVKKTPILAGSEKKRLILQFVGAFVLLCIGVMISPSDKTSDETVSNENITTTQIESSAAVETETTEAATEEITETVAENTQNTQSDISEQETEASTEDITHRTSDDIIGVSNKSLSSDGIKVDYENSVRNDSTGNWRLARIADNINIEEYALDYYKNYFKNDDEIHAIINFTNNTTTNISHFGNILFITIHKYVDKEEHDADLLFSGEIISEFCVYTDNGDIEKVS